MTYANILIGNPNSGLMRGSQSNYIVKTLGGDWYKFFVSQVDNSLYWTKSEDDGFSWFEPILIKSISTQGGVAVWYDKWTPGDTGTIIHLAYYETSADDVLYRPLDTSDDSLGTEVVIFAGASVGAVANTCISITKAIGGNLYVAFDIDGGTEVGFYRSTDAGANWTSRADVNEAGGSDYYLLAPGFAADTQDIICIFWDRSASEISRKLYDDSGDAWSETSIAASMLSVANSTCAPQFSITVDDANNKILLAAWTNRDTANADLRFWSIDESAITEGTEVVLNSVDDQQMCALGLATDTATLYCFYGGKSDGSESAGGDIHIYYKASADGGATWGSETLLSPGGRNYNYLMTVPVFAGQWAAAYIGDASAAPDALLFSALFPSGGGLAAPMFGGGVVL